MDKSTKNQVYPKHLVVFYAKDKSLWAQCANLFTAVKPSSWVYIADEHGPEMVEQSFKKYRINLKGGEVLLSETFHFRQQVVRIPDIINSIKEKVGSLQLPSTKKLLFLVEMTWAVRTPSGAIYLREYEAAIHRLANELELTICCLYNENIMLDDQLMTAIQTHPSVVTQAGLKENPHFLPPTIFVKRNQREQYKYWLGKIDPSIETTELLESEENDFSGLNSRSEREMRRYNIATVDALTTADSDRGRWKIRCFGELKIYRQNGDSIDWNTKGGSTRKLKTLFAYLLFKGGKGATIEELVDMLWPDTNDLKVSANRLYHSVRYLKMILSPELAPKAKSPFILNRDSKYFLAVPSDTWVDLPMFQELCFKGNRHLQNGDATSALISYQSAERLYQGDLLAGIPSKYIEDLEHDWCWSRRYWFRDMNHKLLCEIAAIHREKGGITEALTYCDKAIATEPSSEKAHQEKMKTLAAAGRLDALGRQYRLYCKALQQFDLGEPSTATRELFRNLSKNLSATSKNQR